jgi:hypothetical protein
MKNLIENVKLYFKFVKKLIIDFFSFFLLLRKITLDEIFFDSKIKEPFRELIKTFRYYLTIKLDLYYFFNFIIKKAGSIRFFKWVYVVFEYILKYFLVFIFILWILFESLFFRFYLVDTPLDNKMFQDKKEFKKSRFIPIIGFEALSFYGRPFWRTMNNIMVFISNLNAICWLIYYVYILDLFFVLGFLFSSLLQLLLFFLNFFSLSFFYFKLLLDRLFFVYLLFFWRFFYFCLKIFSFFNYLFLLPLNLMWSLFNLLFYGIFNMRRFLIFCKPAEIKHLLKIFMTRERDYYKKTHEKYVYDSGRINFLFDRVFFICYCLEEFILKIYLKTIVVDIKNPYFLHEVFFSQWVNNFKLFRVFFFFGQLVYYLYLICCYFLLFISLFIFFLNFIYLPFF